MNPATLMEMIRGYQPAQVILTAHQVGIFRLLGAHSLPAATIAAELGLSPRGTTILLDALVALELLVKQRDRYANSDTARRVLSGQGAEDRSPALDHYADLMRMWSRLAESVVSGHSCRTPEEHLTRGASGKNAVFIGAMAVIGRANARIIAQALDLSRYRTLLDIGGGPGVYAEEILRVNPAMRAIVADLPLTLQSARPLVEQGEFAHRIAFREIDAYREEPLAGGFDVALLSNVIHMEGPEENRALLQRVHDAMEPGGMIILHEKIIDPDRASPRDAALFAVNMLVNTERGNCYTTAELASWLQEAGFAAIEEVECFGHPSVIVARKTLPD